MAGRPTKRTPEREARLLDALRSGTTRNAACLYAGVEIHTFQNWFNRFSHFSQAVQKAEAESEVARVARIARAGQSGVWQADAWWLERRRPEDYGRRDRVNHDMSGEVNFTLVIDRDRTIEIEPVETTLELNNGYVTTDSEDAA